CAAAERDHVAMRQLGHLPEAETVDLMPHHVDPEPRDEDASVFRYGPQRGEVEVIEMMVREVDVVGFEELLANRRVRGKVPPRPPVAGPRQPRVDENGFGAGGDEQAGVPDHCEAHRVNYGSDSTAGPVMRRSDRRIRARRRPR